MEEATITANAISFDGLCVHLIVMPNMGEVQWPVHARHINKPPHVLGLDLSILVNLCLLP